MIVFSILIRKWPNNFNPYLEYIVHALPIAIDDVVQDTEHALAVTVSLTICGPTSSVALSTPPAATVYVFLHSSELSVTSTISLVIGAEPENIKGYCDSFVYHINFGLHYNPYSYVYIRILCLRDAEYDL